MKILISTESFYPNIDGGAVAQHNLAHELKKRGHEVHVIAPAYSSKNTIEKENGITIYRTRAVKLPIYMKGRYYFSPFPFFKVGKIIKKIKPDIVNICSPYFIGVSAYIWARKNNIPIVASIHVLPENLTAQVNLLKKSCVAEKLFWNFLVYIFNLVDWATIPTKTGAEMYKRHGLKINITPISNGINTRVFNPKNNGEYLRKKFKLPERNIVLYSGRISAEKNLDVMIKAIPYVVKEINAHFLFVGSGGEYKQSLINLAKDLKIIGHTTFTDFLDWEDYPNIFAVADIFAMPSEAELQSIVTMEAVASGLPIIVVNKGALPELASMNNGYIFEPQNSKQMAECIIKILSDKNLQNNMKLNSLKLIKKHTLESITTQFEQVYEKTIELHNKKN